MRNGFGVFFAIVIALGASWTGFVVAPAVQLGSAKHTAVLVSGDTWPQQRTGEATLGLQIYRANGCVACHTTQIRQDGMACEVVLAKPGKNPAAVSKVISDLKLSGLTKEEADAISEKISGAGGTAETRVATSGTDISCGWGVRQSVAADFLYDAPVQFGNLRVGPDIANVGARSDAGALLQRLYAPQSINKNSRMPSYKFLFEVRKKIGGEPSPDALKLPDAFAPAKDYEVIPKSEAKRLAAYLLSLRADAPLYEAPFTPLQNPTNTPAQSK
jgi:cytochrome c oxidase cbb3-type subunit 2